MMVALIVCISCLSLSNSAETLNIFLAALKKPLDKYIKQWNGLVKLYRTGKRVGLIEARTLGAQKSTGDAIVVLDAHCECV
jgi:hypothetical protein